MHGNSVQTYAAGLLEFMLSYEAHEVCLSACYDSLTTGPGFPLQLAMALHQKLPHEFNSHPWKMLRKALKLEVSCAQGNEHSSSI